MEPVRHRVYTHKLMREIPGPIPLLVVSSMHERVLPVVMRMAFAALPMPMDRVLLMGFIAMPMVVIHREKNMPSMDWVRGIFRIMSVLPRITPRPDYISIPLLMHHLQMDQAFC